jgi:alkylated DNA repair dioxygenase AlkB
MLKGISHDQQKQAAQRYAELPHFTAAAGILNFYQPGIIDSLGEVNFWRPRPARDPAA